MKRGRGWEGVGEGVVAATATPATAAPAIPASPAPAPTGAAATAHTVITAAPTAVAHTIPPCMHAPSPLFVHPHAHLHSSVLTLLLVLTRLWVHPPCAYAVALVPATWSCARPPLPLFVHPHPRLRSSMLTLPLVPACSRLFPLGCAYTPPCVYAHACLHLPLLALALTFVRPRSVALVPTTWSSLLAVSASNR
jgi:hypothetical protein